MTQDEIIKLAKETLVLGPYESATGFNAENAIKFANLVAQHERKACAKMCDAFQARDVGMQPAECAGAIRARGQV
jgi:hypothetical protein